MLDLFIYSAFWTGLVLGEACILFFVVFEPLGFILYTHILCTGPWAFINRLFGLYLSKRPLRTLKGHFQIVD